MKQNIFIKALSMLQAKPLIGGLEIGDSSLRFVVWDGKSFKMSAFRLEPGIIQAGKIVDKKQFIEALKSLHAQILGDKKENEKISVIIALSSISIYTQIFSLPLMEGENLDKAVELNIQMISPLDFSDAYAGWQFASREKDKNRLEILSAFVGRAVINEFVESLEAAGFLPVAAESRGLSLSRLLKESAFGLDLKQPYVFMSVDEGGIDFLIIRHKQLHFDYFVSWRDIQGSAKEINQEVFRSALLKNLSQVLNFYNSHWPEPLTELLLITTAFHDDIIKIIQENLALKIRDVNLNLSQAVSPDWFVALGSAVRGMLPRRKDAELSLLGLDIQEEFGREQILGFLRFWRMLMPSAIAIFLVAFLGMNLAMSNIQDGLETKIASGSRGAQSSEIKGIQAEILNFNKAVSFVAAVERGSVLQAPIIGRLTDLLKKNNITLSRIYYQGQGAPISLAATAKSQDELIAFKGAMEKEPNFTGVSLPLASIKVGPQGVDFSMLFSEVPSKGL